MENQQQELTPEQYKAAVSRQRFAEQVARYEDDIASLIVTNRQLQQQAEQAQQRIEELQEALNATKDSTDSEG